MTARVSARAASSRSRSAVDGSLVILLVALPRTDWRLCVTAARAETGVPDRMERVRATLEAVEADEGVEALLTVGRVVPVGVSRPDDAGGFLTTVAILC